ncbi:MAG: molybdenum cofactor guanylyltransferase [Acidobacteria bacterium]|nr:molybdenum cofactor guanylyltransferase [Acidobacteriota bacterium]
MSGTGTTSAAILAGGHARRFDGRDKSRLVVEGHPIIVRQLRVLQPLADEIFVVAPDPARFADLGLKVYADRRPGLGAIGGIETALATAGGDRVLVLACDLPFVTEALLAELVARAADGDGAWVRGARGIEPLIACYRRSALAAVDAAIDAGRLAARGLADVLRMREIGPAELDAFGGEVLLLANVNTPADYARVQYGGR